MIENAISTDSFSSQAEFSTQYCLTDLGEGVGSSNPKMLLPLLKRKELDSKTFSNDEIILGNFKGNDSLPLANRGNAFVSLRRVLEILSKTELYSDIVDNFQDEVFGVNDVKFLTSLTPKFVATSVYDRKHRLESTRIGRDSSLCFCQKRQTHGLYQI